MSFIAQYHGECEDCGEELRDSEVTYRASELVHVQCPDGTTSLFERPSSPLCDRCYCYHAGDC